MGAPASSYRAADIEVLEGLEPVRKRPGMYIGGTDNAQGLHHLVKEILDNAVDEAMNGHADRISVTLHKDGESLTIEDNGRGIPVDIHPKFKKSALEIILTTLHSGGKFSERNYVSAGGLHGVGASVVNALSSELVATVWREGYEWVQSFSRGKATGKIEKGKKSKEHGTRIFFRPDDQIFKDRTFSSDRIEKLIREKAFLNRGLTVIFHHEASGEKKEYRYDDGIASYLRSLVGAGEEATVGGEIFTLERSDGIKVDVAFCWTEQTQEKILSYVNGIHTAQGGTHEDSFRAGLGKALRNYMNVHELVPKGVKITSEDLREGLVAVLSVNVPGSVTQLQFQGQTKDKLNNEEVGPPVEGLMRSFENLLNSKPTVSSAIIERVTLAAKARQAARSASESVSRKVGISHRLNLPGKLADCSSNRPDESELFIVEGDSAGGTAKQGRDRRTQAVLPLRGKILNSFAAASGKVSENRELTDLIAALGCGSGDQMKLDRLRYGKAIILCDADADGMHIASLLMAFFFRCMRPLLSAGNVYVGMCPLYRIKFGSGSREEVHWVYSDEEKDRVLKERTKSTQFHVTRFKGLGEMNPKTLWETTLNPKSRKLLRITVDSEQSASELFEKLLGKDPSARYRLIQENAHRLEIDV